jgi:hypothetical protein
VSTFYVEEKKIPDMFLVVEKGLVCITASGFHVVFHPSDLSLCLQHNRLIFSASSSSEGKLAQYFRSWELPFIPSPRSVTASYNGTTLSLAVSLPPQSPEKTFLVGQFKVPASSTGFSFFLSLENNVLSFTFRSRAHPCGRTTTQRAHPSDLYPVKV